MSQINAKIWDVDICGLQTGFQLLVLVSLYLYHANQVMRIKS